MGLNTTDEEQRQTAEQELAEKIRLEKPFTRDLMVMFRKIASDLGTSLGENGGVVSAVQYEENTRFILNRGYLRAQRAFSHEILDFLQSNRNNLEEPIISDLSQIAAFTGISIAVILQRYRQALRGNLDAFRRFNVDQSAEIITGTTQREIDRAVVNSREKLSEQLERQPTNTELARASSASFLRRQRPRAAMISATETQAAAEGSKQVERDTLGAFVNSSQAALIGIPKREIRERWRTQGDSLVRTLDSGKFDHLAADGQFKKDGVYTVSGELLRFPGDRLLGASIGNVARCRCSSITIIDD